MKNWASTGVTNTLSLINAFLLLLLVVNGTSPKRGISPHGNLAEMGPAPSISQPANPHSSDVGQGEGPAAQAAQGGDFNFQNMVYSALRCPSDATLTISDGSCKGKDAETRRKFVDSLSDQNLPPRMMFDKIIEKFGEKALSDEALEIRKNNRRQ